MILDEERGRHGPPAIEGANAPYEDWLRQCFYPLPVPARNEPPMKGSYTLPEFVKKNQSFPDLAQ